MAIAPIKKVDTERKHNVTKSIENFEPKKLQSEQKQKRRHIGNLPTIQEDNVDDEIIDCSKLGLIRKKTSDKNVPKSVRQSLNSDRVEKDMIKPKHGRYNSNIHLMQDPRSADILSSKAKAQNLKSHVSSDQEDATTEATRVSSGQSNSRVAKK